jgi:hypothetical protein
VDSAAARGGSRRGPFTGAGLGAALTSNGNAPLMPSASTMRSPRHGERGRRLFIEALKNWRTLSAE